MTKRQLTPAGQMRDIKDDLGEIGRREPVPPTPDAGWRKEVWVATRDLGPFHTPDFVTDTHSPLGVPTWTAVNVGLTLVGELCRGFRGDPFNCSGRQYDLMTDGVYRRVAPGNWVCVLTYAQALALAGGDDWASFGFAENGMDTSINQQGHVGVIFNTSDSGMGWRPVYLVSQDYGATWAAHPMSAWQAAGAQAHSLTIGAFKGSSPYAAGQAMYAIGRWWANTHLWYSTDGGVSWGHTNIGLGAYTAHCLVDPNDQSRVFIGCFDGAGPWNVYVSLDHGATVAQYDAAASEDLGYPAPYYHLSVAMDELKIVRVGAATVPQHIHTTRDDGIRWEETTPQYSATQLGISIVQDSPNLLYLLRQSSGDAFQCHVVFASENEGRDMVPKAGANACVLDTGGGDSIPRNCGGVRGILQIWTDRAEGDIPGVPSPRDIGQFPGEISEEQLVDHGPTHENGGADEIGVGGLSGLLADPQTPLAHDILSAFHGDTLAAAVSRGSLIIGNATPRWSELVIGGANLVLLSDGVDAAWGVLRSISVNDANPGLTITQAGAGFGLIVQGGYVGIGTVAPTELLHIKAYGDWGMTLRVENTFAGRASMFWLTSNAGWVGMRTYDGTREWQIGQQIGGVGSDYAIQDLTATTNPFRIESTAPTGALRLLADGFLQADYGIEFTGSVEVTIAAGVITITRTYHDVDTQADDATDDLDTINGGTPGRILILTPENNGRTVVVKHATGNIRLDGGVDFSMDTLEDKIMLLYDNRTAHWTEVSRSNNA